MALVLAKRQTPEERENEHNDWLSRKLYAKTPLTTFNACREKFRLRYVERRNEEWGDELIRGIAGHKVIETMHDRQMQGGDLFEVDAREVFLQEIARLEHRAMGRLSRRDEYANQVMAALRLYKRSWKRWYDDILSVEETWGVEKPVYMGGHRVAGHSDIKAGKYRSGSGVMKQGVYVPDLKFVSPQSGHRKPKPMDLGMEMYKKGLEASRTAILPIVIGFKNQPKDLECEKTGAEFVASGGPLPVKHTEGTLESVEAQIHSMVSAIERGDLDGGPPEVGTFLCQPRYCSFFGRCKFTKALNVEDYR